jgi:hypothetical protein
MFQLNRILYGRLQFDDEEVCYATMKYDNGVIGGCSELPSLVASMLRCYEQQNSTVSVGRLQFDDEEVRYAITKYGEKPFVLVTDTKYGDGLISGCSKLGCKYATMLRTTELYSVGLNLMRKYAVML